jgi:hypothetical protein
MTHAESPCLGKHRPGCVEPRTQRRVNSIGVVWVTCQGCGAYWQDADGRDGLRRVVGSMTSGGSGGNSVPTSVETAAENRTPVEIVVPPSSGYRCAEHLDQPVNWRGKGCPLCPKGKPKTRKADKEGLM